MKLYKVGEKAESHMRVVWKKEFLEFGRKYEKMVALTADLSYTLCTTLFAKEVKDRFFNIGIAEQNMLGIAAGLALNGKIPYVDSFAPFVTLRACEQFRTDICYMNLNVRVIGAYGGVTPAGTTHSGTDDAGTIRGFANSTVVAVSDPTMFRKILEATINYSGPVYIRLDTGGETSYIYKEDYDFIIGSAIITKKGKDATIISMGNTLAAAVAASKMLENEGIVAGVIDMHTLKPFDSDVVRKAISDTGVIITVEDHSIYNGLGSAVAEVIAENGKGCKFKRLGVPDCFAVYGNHNELERLYGFDAQGIVDAVRALLSVCL
jgi:transketolase